MKRYTYGKKRGMLWGPSMPDGEYVLASDYDALEMEHRVLRSHHDREMEEAEGIIFKLSHKRERSLLLAIRAKAVDMDLGNESTVMALWAAVDAYDEAMK